MSITFAQKYLGTYKNLNLDTISCGAVAIADIAYNTKSSISPIEVAKWLIDKGYLTSSGTSRTGITEGLKHYNYNSLYFKDDYANGKGMDTFFDLLNVSETSDVWAIALMGNCGNSYWTKGGHYIAITCHVKNNNKDYYYVRDGANGRSGWHSKDEFKGCFVSGWIITKLY